MLLGTGYSVEVVDTIVKNLPSVATTPEIRQRMNVVNALSLGTDVYLHYDWSSVHETLVPIARILRLSREFSGSSSFPTNILRPVGFCEVT